MANPPFNISEWRNGGTEDDPRWVYPLPPNNNANSRGCCTCSIISSLMVLILANGSISSKIKCEGEIRRAFVECMFALSGKFYFN